jgi:hypothetical protein
VWVVVAVQSIFVVVLTSIIQPIPIMISDKLEVVDVRVIMQD